MLEKLNRLKYMDYLIRVQGTGTMRELADKLEVSRSTCGEYIRLLREMGAKIQYCHSRKSYKYDEPMHLVVGYKS